MILDAAHKFGSLHHSCTLCSFQHTHQHTHAALDDGAPCAMTLIIIGVSSAAAYHSLARTRSISAMCVYVYLCVDIPRHTCCAVGPSPNSWPPRDVCTPLTLPLGDPLWIDCNTNDQQTQATTNQTYPPHTQVSPHKSFPTTQYSVKYLSLIERVAHQKGA